MVNEETKFIDAISALIKGQVVTLNNGDTITIDMVHFARLPNVVTDNLNIVVVPKGLAFPISQLGQGSRMKARDRYVNLDIYVFFDGIDEETVIKTVSDITVHLCNAIIEANVNRIADSDWCDIGEINYDWAAADEQDMNTLQVTSLSVIPVSALYRR